MRIRLSGSFRAACSAACFSGTPTMKSFFPSYHQQLLQNRENKCIWFHLYPWIVTTVICAKPFTLVELHLCSHKIMSERDAFSGDHVNTTGRGRIRQLFTLLASKLSYRVKNHTMLILMSYVMLILYMHGDVRHWFGSSNKTVLKSKTKVCLGVCVKKGSRICFLPTIVRPRLKLSHIFQSHNHRPNWITC